MARAGDLVYSRGYGYANLDYGIPNTPQTVFDVASVTKQFIAAVANLLAQDGTVSLDDDVRRWLPELPEYAAPVTLRHLIFHTGGLRDYLNLFPLAGAGDYYSVSREQLLAMMSRQRAPVFAPGERYEYSNTGYMLLAHALERAAGKSIGELAGERIFEPLGMNGSLMYENRERIIPRRATGYHRDDDGGLRVVHNYNFEIAGDGQLYTTVEDLLLWDDYLHGADRPAIHESMLTEGTLNDGEPIGYAHGTTPGEYRGPAHRGAQRAFLGIPDGAQAVRGTGSRDRSFRATPSTGIPASRRGASPTTTWRIGWGPKKPTRRRTATKRKTTKKRRTARTSRRTATPTSRRTATPTSRRTPRKRKGGAPPVPSLSSAELAEYAGSFFSAELDATYRFAAVDGGLVVRVEQQPALAVKPVAEDEFRVEFESRGWAASPARIEFQRDGTGSVTGFSLSSGSEQGLVFEKQPALELR